MNQVSLLCRYSPMLFWEVSQRANRKNMNRREGIAKTKNLQREKALKSFTIFSLMSHIFFCRANRFDLKIENIQVFIIYVNA